MDTDGDIVSELKSLQTKIEDLEIRVSKVLEKQFQTKQELDRIQEKPEKPIDPMEEGEPELKLPEDYHFTEDLQKLLENLVEGQKAWQESVKTKKTVKTGIEGPPIFKDMNKHLLNRLEFLDMTKKLLEGPLLPDLPPPPPPVEEPVVEEPKVEKGGKKGKKK